MAAKAGIAYLVYNRRGRDHVSIRRTCVRVCKIPGKKEKLGASSFLAYSPRLSILEFRKIYANRDILLGYCLARWASASSLPRRGENVFQVRTGKVEFVMLKIEQRGEEGLRWARGGGKEGRRRSFSADKETLLDPTTRASVGAESRGLRGISFLAPQDKPTARG